MKRIFRLWGMAAALSGLGSGLVANAEIDALSDAEAKGLAIAVAADKRDEGWADWSANAEMVLTNSYGQSSSRQMSIKALEQEDEGDRRLITFSQPRDVYGTAFLVYTKKVGDDDRWLYLPALKRVKRISSSNQTGPFLGSEFAYEDLASPEVEKYSYRYVGEEEFEGMPCYVIERYPVDKNSGYTKQVVWLDKQEYRNWKTEYYDRKGALLKVLLAKGFQSYGADYWRADVFSMSNVQTKKSTDLIWSDYVLTQGLNDRDFDKNALKRSR